MRYVLDLSYRGTDYAGWQVQPNAPSIQAALNQALCTALREDVYALGAGRTDAGVHARQLFAHFDTATSLTDALLPKLNGLLPRDIAVNALYTTVDPDFHVRFSAHSRAYTYTIVSRKDPLWQDFACWIKYPLDLPLMNAAAAILLEYESFGSFCKAHSGSAHHRCDLHHAYWTQEPDRLVFHVRANRFLRGMVRALVGTLLLVGRHKMDLAAFRQVIEQEDRRAAGPAAPAQGLSLVEVQYPPESLRLLASASAAR
jgi:tRNA pseudouridine38-40 synthase